MMAKTIETKHVQKEVMIQQEINLHFAMNGENEFKATSTTTENNNLKEIYDEVSKITYCFTFSICLFNQYPMGSRQTTNKLPCYGWKDQQGRLCRL